MKLASARILNYRSIEDLTIDFEHGCEVLIGINESGKSNILRALHLLDPLVEVKPGDLRLQRTAEQPEVDKGSIFFKLVFEESEVEALYQAVIHHFEANSIDVEIVTDGSDSMSLRQFCEERAFGLIDVHLPSGKRIQNYYAIPQSYRILPGWFRNQTDSPIVLKDASGTQDLIVPARGFVYLEGGAPSDVPGLVATAAGALAVTVGEEVKKIIALNAPKCIFWKYSEQYLLPASIDVNTFSQDPNSCIPLRSMFELAGCTAADLPTKIAAAKAHSHHRYIQFLRRAADAATAHIRKVWKDHKTIKIELHPNGELLVPLITEAEVPLDMASRSDGFKRFVSFLLQISAKVKTNELKNILLLIDEPEIAMHPAGARSLMRELIEIGGSNTVVYSTHSIFMIDRNEIGRHLIVEKQEEVTTARRAEKSRLLDEEVLYAAVGYSVFESLKERNVIFEGWRDKELFRVISDAMCKADKALKAEISEIGMTFAEGVKDVKHVARFLQLASRDCLIISDADAPAIQGQNEYAKPGSWGQWVTLKDILGGNVPIHTAEDLILRAAVIKRANKFRANAGIEGLKVLEAGDFGATESTIGALTRWLRSVELTGKELQTTLDDLKRAMFDKLKREEISDAAEGLVQFVRGYSFKSA